MMRLLLISLLLLTSCKIGPDYVKPKVDVPAAFKEAPASQPTDLMQPAKPQDHVAKGPWWEVFSDQTLNELTTQVAINNNNVLAAEAQYRQARALVQQARSSYFPTLDANASATRGSTAGGKPANRIGATLDANWELDLWGRIRRQVESSKADLQASEADLAALTLSAQAELVTDYMQLRVIDARYKVLQNTLENYRRSRELTQNLYDVGIVARVDVIRAESQLQTTEAQAIDVKIARAQFEHAIAVILGKAPADFSLAAVESIPALPAIPEAVPSDLLQRRPDVAAAERRVAAANAQIGVARGAFFPLVSLGASLGFQNNNFSNLFALPNRVWSIGPSIVQSIFDGGLRASQTDVAIAQYDATVAQYRQQVLTSFQEVEDNYAALNYLAQEQTAQQKALELSRQSSAIATNQYKAGITSYLDVITAQNATLTSEITALNVQGQQLTASVALIKALGGGWQGLKP